MMMRFFLIQAGRIAKKFAILTACFWFLTACEEQPRPTLQAIPPEKSEYQLSRAIYSAYLQLDPQFVKVAADAAPVRDLLVGLVAYQRTGEIIPAMAQEWFSDDGKNWLFILTENARWSNGQPVTAEDFVASWQRLADPQNGSPLAPYLVYMNVENAKQILSGEKAPETLGVQALNPYTLQIRLQQPQFNLPYMLAHAALLPTYQGKKPEEGQNFISNGSYKVLSRSKTQLTLQAVDLHIPFQKVNYQLISTIQNPDRFDILENPLATYHRHITSLPRLCTYFYEFNLADPLLQHKAVRQAIRTMVSSIEVSHGFGIPNHFVLPKTMVMAQNSLQFKVSPEQLLNSIDIDAANPVQLTLTYDNQGYHNQIAQRIIRTLSQSDLFRIVPEEVSWHQLLQKRELRQFQLIRSGWCADHRDPVLFLLPFHSQSPDNKSGYHNEQVDEMLTQLKTQPLSPSEREQLILRIVYQLESDIAILPLFQYQRRIAFDPTIEGIDIENDSEVIYSKDLYRDKE